MSDNDTDDLRINPSALPAIGDCQRRYIAATLEKERGIQTAQSVSSVMGKALHHFADQGGDGVAATLIAEISKGFPIAYTEATPTKQVAQRQLRLMIESWRQSYPNWRSDGGDREVRMEYESQIRGQKIVISCIADKIIDGVLHDVKTSNKKNFKMGSYGSQMGAYASVAEKLGYGDINGEIKEIIVHHLPLGGGYIEKYKYDVEVCKKEFRNAVVSIKKATDIYKKRNDLNDVQANPSSMLCSVTFCPVHGTDSCKITKKKSEELNKLDLLKKVLYNP